jgi:hypothetical protein
LSAVIPPRFLFHWSWPVKRWDSVPAPQGQLLTLPEEFRMTALGDVDGMPSFVELRLAWNDAGLGLSFEIRDKQEPVFGSPLSPATSDGVTIWLDTRPTRAVQRVTRFCRQFRGLPAGSGPRRDQPTVTASSAGDTNGQRSRAASAKGDEPVRVWSELRDDGYLLELWLPAEALPGYDPDSHRQLGFFYAVQDRELGDETLTVSREFPFEHNPSLWQTLELTDASTKRR